MRSLCFVQFVRNLFKEDFNKINPSEFIHCFLADSRKAMALSQVNFKTTAVLVDLLVTGNSIQYEHTAPTS
jgi:hypothetical protein